MSGSPFAVDFGVNVPGEAQVSLTGTTDATAYVIHKKITVVNSSVPSGRMLLPSSYASGTELRVVNRSGQTIQISPGSNNQVEAYGVGVTVEVYSPGNANFTSFDPPASPAPRTWWLT